MYLPTYTLGMGFLCFTIDVLFVAPAQCDQKKSPNVYKRCPKMIALEK